MQVSLLTPKQLLIWRLRRKGMRGEIYVKIGSMKVEIRSLDIDRDGIIDPLDGLEINNYIILPLLGIFYISLCASLEFMVKKCNGR